jgi:phosphatidylglycerophosphatase A
MPGTVGTLGALPLYLLVRNGGPWAIAFTAAVIAVLGVWAAGVVERERAEVDPQIVVVDEVCGVLVALAVAPATWLGVLAATVLFRVFDITKPSPARAAERLGGGLGIVADDVVAGLWAAAFVLLLRFLGALG